MKKSRGLDAWRDVAKSVAVEQVCSCPGFLDPLKEPAKVPDPFSTASSGPCSSSATSPAFSAGGVSMAEAAIAIGSSDNIILMHSLKRDMQSIR